MKRVQVTREQLIEWIRYKAGELRLRDVSDDTLLLMADGLDSGDVVVTANGEYLVKARSLT